VAPDDPASAIQFQQDHGRPATPVEALQLGQQATLETRDAKHEPRSLTEQRATWLSEAAAVLGSSEAVASMVATALTPAAETRRMADAHWVAQTADGTVGLQWGLCCGDRTVRSLGSDLFVHQTLGFLRQLFGVVEVGAERRQDLLTVKLAADEGPRLS
jgi:hypothetical protein